MTNEQRTASGLAPLSECAELTKSAEAKARHMLANDYWAHDAPDGTKPWYFIKSNGYQYRAAGENLAKDFTSDASVVKAWMKSPAHRANILNSAYKEIGIAAVDGTFGGRETTLVVAHYGAREKPAAATKQINPQTNTKSNKFKDAGSALAMFVNALGTATGLIIGRQPN